MVELLYKSGIPVNLTDQFSGIRCDIEGFLIEFTFKETPTATAVTYKFYFKKDFKSVDQKRNDLEEGYYSEVQFLKYIENTGPNIPLGSDMIYKYKFNFTKYLAKAGDAISVQVTNFGTPFDLFYSRDIYNFTIENNIDGKTVRRYAEPTLDGFEVIDYILSLPSAFSASSALVPNQENTPGYYFYAKNLGDFINDFTNDGDKRKFKKITILIIFKIRYIMKEIFPYLVNNSGFTIEDVDNIANNPTADLSGNPANALKEMLFILKKTWGYYYVPNSTLPHRSSIPALFNAQSLYSDYEYYYIGVVSFYRKCYRIPHALSSFPNEIKFDYLIEILSVNGLSVLPIEIIKKALLRIMKEKSISEELEQLVVRLVLSIAANQADNFLDFLLEQENCINTNFERLYKLLDDARIERIPIASWFAEEKTNRMAFVYAVYELWKVSRYDLLGPNEEINTQCYFLNDGIGYLKEPNGQLKTLVLECGRLTSVESGNPAMPLQTNTWVNYEADKTLKKELVTIYQNIDITNYYLSSSGKLLGAAPSLDRDYKFETKYHLYQPIILTGHRTDDRVMLPNNQAIPAFLFFYTKDFERLLKIDAQIALAVSIGVEVVLFFTFGGLTQLRHLQHLKYVTKIRAALGGTLPATEEVLVWSGLHAGSQTLSVTSAMIFSLGQYNATILPTAAEREAREKANMAFLYLTLVFAGGSVLFRYKAVEAAEYALLDTTATLSMNPDVKNVMIALVGEYSTVLSNFSTRLSNLPLEDINKIVTRFESFADDIMKQRAFYKDFGHLDDASQLNVWNAMNKTSVLDNWEALYALQVFERNELSIISRTSITNAYVRYYGQSALKGILERQSLSKRLAFFELFGDETILTTDLFNKCIIQPNKLELLLEAGNSIKKGHLDELLDSDILKVIDSSLNNSSIDLLRIKNLSNVKELILKFSDEVHNVEIDLNRLAQLRDGTAFSFNLSPAQQELFLSVNKMFAETKVYNGTTLVDTFEEVYVAGYKTYVNRIFGTNYPDEIVEPTLDVNYNVFKSKAHDIINGSDRFDDTELKYIFNLLENHWNSGNRFDIVLESTYYSCPSCQGYLLYLKKLAAQEGKILNITIKANKNATDFKKLYDILNNQ